MSGSLVAVLYRSGRPYDHLDVDNRSDRLALDDRMSFFHLEKWCLKIAIGEFRQQDSQSEGMAEIQYVNGPHV
jgi:hypothetical protein